MQLTTEAHTNGYEARNNQRRGQHFAIFVDESGDLRPLGERPLPLVQIFSEQKYFFVFFARFRIEFLFIRRSNSSLQTIYQKID